MVMIESPHLQRVYSDAEITLVMSSNALRLSRNFGPWAAF